jgi:dihydrolipoamide dehydrogenase
MVMGDLVTEVDVAVVGGGPGGYTAAFRCAELGLETVIVDAGKRLGGACLFEGCIPSKALLHVAAILGEAERARELGVDFGAPHISLDPLRKWKTERVVGKLARGLTAVAKGKHVEVIGGRAVFEDSRTLLVQGDEPQKVKFRHAIVATGSRPAQIPGIDLVSERVMDSTGALEVPEIPERLLVVGGGYIGLELGQVYATLVEMTDGLLPGADRDLVQWLARRVDKQFQAVKLTTRVESLRETPAGIEARLGGDTAVFDRVLVAVGRRPQSDGLGLETTRVRVSDRGFVEVDVRGATADPRIFAVGDVTGEPMLAHRAMRQAKVAAETIAGRPAAFDNVVVPAVVFTDPELAWCGLTETAAAAQGVTVRVAKFQWAASGRAATLGRADGVTKLVVDAESGRVVGAGIAGAGAGELIAEAALAIESALLAEDVALTIHAHPTLSETWMEAAETLLRG